MRDYLRQWCRIREQIDWVGAADPITGPIRGRRDGVLDHVHALATRAPDKAARLLAALRRVRVAAQGRGELSFDLLAGWQTEVLGRPVTGFRTGPALAKGGRELYGLDPDTENRFGAYLAEATESSVPLASRAARAYLDVAFFHPFADGNARAAMLCLYFVLLRDDVVIDLAAPVLRTVRRADDRDGAVDLARLISVLIAATRRRGAAVHAQGC